MLGTELDLKRNYKMLFWGGRFLCSFSGKPEIATRADTTISHVFGFCPGARNSPSPGHLYSMAPEWLCSRAPKGATVQPVYHSHTLGLLGGSELLCAVGRAGVICLWV